MRFKHKTSKSSWYAQRQELIIRLFTAIFFIGIILLFFFLWRSFRRVVWDGQSQINITVQTDDIVLLSYHPKEGMLNSLIIPKSTHLEVVGGLGEYPINNIIKLGKTEKIDGGILLSRSLQKFLAAPIDGYIIQVNNQSANGWTKIKNDDIKNGKLLTMDWCWFSRECQSNLSFWDILRLTWVFSQLKPNQIKAVKFEEEGILQEKTLPDNSQILAPDYLVIDKLSLALFSDQSVLDEELTIEILNATEKPGLANAVARMVKNLGAELINTGDADERRDNTLLISKNKNITQSYTWRRLNKIFSIKNWQIDKQAEAEITLILGKDTIPLL